MTTRRLFCFAAASALAPRAWAGESAPELLKDIRRRLADDALLRGAFEQSKTIKGFRHPLRSRGDFVVARGRGVLWRTLEPVASSLVATREQILVRQADGSLVRRLQAREEPALRAVTETLFAMLSADLSVLDRQFKVTGGIAGDGWRLALLPQDPMLARWLQRVDLEGQRFLQSIAMQELSGDRTQIHLSRHAAGGALSAQEELLFE